MLFADCFLGVSNSKESVQKLIDVLHIYIVDTVIKDNVSKSSVVMETIL